MFAKRHTEGSQRMNRHLCKYLAIGLLIIGAVFLYHGAADPALVCAVGFGGSLISSRIK